MKTFPYLERYGYKCRMTLHWKKSQYYLANISSRGGLWLCSWFGFSTMGAWSFTQTAAEYCYIFTHLYWVLVLSALWRAFLYTQLFWSFKLEHPFLLLGTRTPFIGYSIARNEMMNWWYGMCIVDECVQILYCTVQVDRSVWRWEETSPGHMKNGCK